MAAWIGQSANVTLQFYQIERASCEQIKLFIFEENSMGGWGCFAVPLHAQILKKFHVS